MNKISLITSAAGVALLLASAAPALAEDGAQVSGDASVHASTSVNADGERQGGGLRIPITKFPPHIKLDPTASTTVHANTEADQQQREQMREEHKASTTQMHIEQAQHRGDNALDMRIKSLQDLISRLSSLKLLPADTLASVKATLQSEIDKLTALKAQIGSDTSTSTLKADLKSITQGNRVFLLVEPKARISSAASRIDAVVTQMQQLGTKFQGFITTAQGAGVDVTAATAAMTDMNAKLADAKIQADAAVAEVANLAVDNGDKTILATNDSALKDARAKLTAAEKDLAAARHDAATIYSIVKPGGGVHGQGDVHASTTEGTH